MAKNLSWRDAIVEVLEGATEPLHYTEIAERIAELELRTDFGATPAASVNATMTVSLQNDGDASPFVRVGRGLYALRKKTAGVGSTPKSEDVTEETDDTGLINAFGMFWSRGKVLWSNSPRILGQQQPGSSPVDFAGQRGVYLLHDARSVVYVGRTTDQTLGRRLCQHTTDRLNGRWDRFSWFGVCSVASDGSLQLVEAHQFNIDSLIVTMEALLIEGLEPPQNRKRGDDFRAIEYLQIEDPEISKSKIVALMDELKSKL